MQKMVSLEKARRTLGPLAKHLTDDQVRQIINSLHLLAKEQLMYNGSKVDENGSTTSLSSHTS